MRSGGTRWAIIDGAAWIVIAVAGSLAVVQAFEWNVNAVTATLQALTPYLGLLLVPVASWSLWRRSYGMTTVACAAGFGLLVLATPIVTDAETVAVSDDAARIRLASVNLLYGNDRVANVAAGLRSSSPDVIVFVEYTPEHQATLQSSELASAYPHRIERPLPRAGGIAVWSRAPVEADDPLDTDLASIDALLDTADGPVRIVAVHVPTPVFDFAAWRHDLRLIEGIGRTTDLPTVVVGDLNASYWHPAFRDLLDAGFVDAHIATGHGFATSWPTNRPFPPFVQLDHALTTDGLAPLDVDNFDLPGSDHHGILATLAVVS